MSCAVRTILVLAAMACLCCCRAAAADRIPASEGPLGNSKVIEWGWGTPSPVQAAELLPNMQQRPFDGLCFTLYANGLHNPALGKARGRAFSSRDSSMESDPDPRETWRYRMLCAPDPPMRISAFRSADGIHWVPAAENPVIGTHPDGPICLSRQADGRYVAYHRPGHGDRRVARTESWDFTNWSETKTVLEPDQDDPTNIQFYGMGAIPYGGYEIGTLWIYQTVPDDMSWTKYFGGRQFPEFVHSRGGYAWHRTAQGVPWIALSNDEDAFECCQIRMASQPVFTEDEIRYYYTGCRLCHGEERQPIDEPRWGLSFASCKPDRFVSVTARGHGAILTRPFWVDTKGRYECVWRLMTRSSMRFPPAAATTCNATGISSSPPADRDSGRQDG